MYIYIYIYIYIEIEIIIGMYVNSMNVTTIRCFMTSTSIPID